MKALIINDIYAVWRKENKNSSATRSRKKTTVTIKKDITGTVINTKKIKTPNVYTQPECTSKYTNIYPYWRGKRRMLRRRSSRPTWSLVGYKNTWKHKTTTINGVSTEDIDVITENTKNPGRRRTENRSSLPPPPFLTKIRKMHYVLFIII